MATKKLRVLADCEVDGVVYRANDVLEIDAKRAKELADVADATPAAVAYCIDELRVEVRVHASGAAAEAPAEPAAPGA